MIRFSITVKIFLILIRACPVRYRSRVGLRFQVRGRKPWGRKAAKRASKVAFLPPRPQRLPPLRAFHLRPHAANLLGQSYLSPKWRAERGERKGHDCSKKSQSLIFFLKIWLVDTIFFYFCFLIFLRKIISLDI